MLCSGVGERKQERVIQILVCSDRLVISNSRKTENRVKNNNGRVPKEERSFLSAESQCVRIVWYGSKMARHLLIASKPRSRIASLSKKVGDKGSSGGIHCKLSGGPAGREFRSPSLRNTRSIGLLRAMLSISPGQYLEPEYAAEGVTYNVSRLHIIEFTLGLGLAGRRWAGRTHAAINDTAVALVPRICAVVVGKGIRGASIHQVRISITLYRGRCTR